MSYAKLFSSITESSLWGEPVSVRLLFVSMLAKADALGFVEAALPGLARIANLPLSETEEALAVLELPDPQSKNTDNDGRRVTKVPGGWVILNYEAYRNRRGEDERREYMRQYMAEYRRKQSVNSGKQKLTTVNHGKPPLAQAEAEAEAEAVLPHKKNKPSVVRGSGGNPRKVTTATADEIVVEFKGNPGYEGIDIQAQWHKMAAWCSVNGKIPSKRRFVNWLNRCERPAVGGNGSRDSKPNPTTEIILAQKELDRVEANMKTLRGQASTDAWGSHFDSFQQDQWDKLKARKNELKSKLGFTV